MHTLQMTHTQMTLHISLFIRISQLFSGYNEITYSDNQKTVVLLL